MANANHLDRIAPAPGKKRAADPTGSGAINASGISTYSTSPQRRIRPAAFDRGIAHPGSGHARGGRGVVWLPRLTSSPAPSYLGPTTLARPTAQPDSKRQSPPNLRGPAVGHLRGPAPEHHAASSHAPAPRTDHGLRPPRCVSIGRSGRHRSLPWSGSRPLDLQPRAGSHPGLVPGRIRAAVRLRPTGTRRSRFLPGPAPSLGGHPPGRALPHERSRRRFRRCPRVARRKR